jgi:antitoxin (DNA-binding transcriptional repressor) of toxin-antitoxin stability system
MLQVNTHEAKTKLSSILAKMEADGEPVLICRNGKAIAQLSAVSSGHRLLGPPHADLQPLRTSEDFDPTAGVSAEDWPEDQR